MTEKLFWYCFHWLNEELTEVEVLKETEHMLLIPSWHEEGKPRRVRKLGYPNYFPSKEEAVQYQRERLRSKLKVSEENYKRKRTDYEKFCKIYGD